MKNDVNEKCNMNDFHGYYAGIDEPGIIGSLVNSLDKQGTIKLDSECEDVLRMMWKDGYLVLPKACFEKIVSGLVLADEMRDLQKMGWVELTNEKELALDSLLADLKKEVGDGSI